MSTVCFFHASYTLHCILFGHDEAETSARLATPAGRRKQDRVQTKC
jgi:hypothetical protein